MKRKLIKQANQAVTITLPIEWIRENNLSPGNEIELEKNERELILRSSKKVSGKKIHLNLNGLNTREKYLQINAAYAKGIDELDIESETLLPELSETIGYVLVSQKNNKFIIKDVSGNSNENLDEIFKRVFQAIINFYESAVEDIFGKEKETMETLRVRDKEINKLCLFLERAIIKQLYENPSNGKILFAYSYALEKIGDEILRFWRANINLKIKKTPELKKIIDISKEGLEKSFDIYYRTDSKKISELLKLRDKFREESTKFLNNSSTSQLIIHANSIIENAHDLTHLSLAEKF